MIMNTIFIGNQNYYHHFSTALHSIIFLQLLTTGIAESGMGCIAMQEKMHLQRRPVHKKVPEMQEQCESECKSVHLHRRPLQAGRLHEKGAKDAMQRNALQE